MSEFKDRYSFNEENHIHTLDGRPLTGTSSVMSVMGKPGLVWWSSGLAVAELGWSNPKLNIDTERLDRAGSKLDELKEMSDQEYLKLLDKAYAAHSKSLAKSATKGKDLHSELEKYVKESIEKHGGFPFKELKTNGDNVLFPFQEWAMEHVHKFLWSEMHTYSELSWLGGISDCGAEMKDGKIAIIDFKSSKAAYSSHFLQIGGYAVQIKENGGYTRSGDKVIEPLNVDQFIVIPFGAPEFTVEIQQDTPAFENGFMAALNLYRLTKEYDDK